MNDNYSPDNRTGGRRDLHIEKSVASESNDGNSSSPKLNEIHRTANKAQSDIKRIIKQPTCFRSENSALTAGRSKRVQFNTLPDFSGLKNRKSMFLLAEFNNNHPRGSNLQQSTTGSRMNNQNDSESGKPLDTLLKVFSVQIVEVFALSRFC